MVADRKAQEDVLQALRSGCTVKEIARKRGTSVQAVYEVLLRLRLRGRVVKGRSVSFRVR